MRYKTSYIGVSLKLGPMDLAQADELTLANYREQKLCVIASSSDEAKRLVDQTKISK